MAEKSLIVVPLVMNGVTGRMGTNQHLIRSILAIREQGGVKLPSGRTIMPKPILVGRSLEKIEMLARAHNVDDYATIADLPNVLRSMVAESKHTIYFDAQTTAHRFEAVTAAMEVGANVYCEKPLASTSQEALELHRLAVSQGIKAGVVQDKLYLPGLLKLRRLIDSGFFGDILSVRGEFGYWVFSGLSPDTVDPSKQAPQRPSWNYRAEEGGGIISDMLCHWQYLIEGLFGRIASLNCIGAVHVKQRTDEAGKQYNVTADDSAYASFELDNGAIAHFNSSWAVRVRRDDLLTLQIDGTKGSAVAGLREVWKQSAEDTPRVVWNPDVKSEIDYWQGWVQEGLMILTIRYSTMDSKPSGRSTYGTSSVSR
ncbi:D-xylose dehydrogenase [Cyphellophora attinorum]|uniref:D-xylose dehydrogenase n=1 Tax=Cyphellophora attinorum TaxID=1664694 RepID=A0A0N1HRP1_9EURO|nr:D-xylose dehydrogenase [Phialophora attinorum]KPI41014.1 D-xylose dehydrogenase [Phialophora attinorum]